MPGAPETLSPVATEVYEVKQYPQIAEIYDLSKDALISHVNSVDTGINLARIHPDIMPNPYGVGVVGVERGDEGKGTWVYRYSHLRHKQGLRYLNLEPVPRLALRGGGGGGTGHVYLPEGVEVPITNSMLPVTEDDDWTKVIGRAVLGRPDLIIAEIARLDASHRDISNRRIMVDGETFLAWDAHSERDRAEEKLRGKSAVGTTKSGVGPAAQDYVGRLGMNFDMLKLPPRELKKIVTEEVERNNRILRSLKSPVRYDPDVIFRQMQEWGEALGPYIQRTFVFVAEALESGDFIFEGAQGYELGRDTGFPGSVTSTNSGFTGLSENYRTTEDHMGHRVGVLKVVSTQVGTHLVHTPVPDEIKQALYKRTAERGLPERGARTGREREFSWGSIPRLLAAKKTYRLNEFVISKADAADGLEYIELGMEYVFSDGTVTRDYDPSDPRMRDPRTRMNTLRLPGWKTSLVGMRDLRDAPRELLAFAAIITELTGVPVVAIGTGPGYDEYAATEQSPFRK